jgi:hypothetical protein
MADCHDGPSSRPTMAGIASPLAYGIAFLIVMMLGVCHRLALHLPSAGAGPLWSIKPRRT